MNYHRWVINEHVPAYLALGWVAITSLEGTHHGQWSAHCIWLCNCRMVEPLSALTQAQRQETP